MIRVSARNRIVLVLVVIVGIVALGQVSSGNTSTVEVRKDGKRTCQQIDACRRATSWQRRRIAKLQAAVAWQKRQVHRARMTARVVSASNLTPLEVGRALSLRHGWAGRQWVCLVTLWSRESGWVPTKANYAGSGAYGIPQALPGSKMASAGPDWATNAGTQIRWGIGYIDARYGDPCGALAQSNAHGYY